MTKRIELNGGHSEISIAGQKYYADEEGCFSVPDNDAPELIRVIGGKYSPGVEGLLKAAEDADAEIANLKTKLELAKETAEKAHTALDNYEAKLKSSADKGGQGQQNNQNNRNNPKK